MTIGGIESKVYFENILKLVDKNSNLKLHSGAVPSLSIIFQGLCQQEGFVYLFSVKNPFETQH